MAIQLTPALEQRLQHLADETHRTPEDLAQEGLDHFLAREEEVRSALQRGRADVAAGRILDQDGVFARVDQILSGR